MDFKVVWTEPALIELEDLVRFIAADDPAAAVRVGDEILDHVELLKTFPEIGPVSRRRAVLHVRQITCRPFRISTACVMSSGWSRSCTSGTERGATLKTWSSHPVRGGAKPMRLAGISHREIPAPARPPCRIGFPLKYTAVTGPRIVWRSWGRTEGDFAC